MSEVKIHKIKGIRGRPKMTAEERLLAFLRRKDDFAHLSEIYRYFRATSNSKRAGIRGLLNRGCGEKGVFVRKEESSGEYKAA